MVASCSSRAGSLSGTGTITADGAPGNISGQDGAGGGGAGGTVAVVTSAGGSSSGFAGLTINARGGRGGNETNASPHGPGGGGGGGRVYTAVTPASVNVSGGANGVHSSGAYGALPGTVGSATLAPIESLPGVNAGANCIDLAVTKTVDTSPVVPGQTVAYTITASNRGPFPRTGTAPVAVSDPMPATLSSVTWTCTATAGSTCVASGSGSLSTVANLAVGGSATYVVTGTLSPSFTGTLSNTATVSPPTGIPELTPLDNTVTALATAAPRADLSITKTDGTFTATPGASTTYTIVASNAGPSTVTAAPITDALPVGATGGTWTCVAGSGATCGAASGALPLASTATLPPGTSATYTAVVAISPTATGSLVNTASIAAPAGVVETDPANNSATDTNTLTPTGDLSITKTDGLTTVDAGTHSELHDRGAQRGPSTITGATVTDVLPASLLGATWTCAASAGSSCPASGGGNITASVTLASGGTATFTVTATVAAAATGTISNTATIAAPGGVNDPTPGNNSATDTNTITRRADLSITKTDGVDDAVPGQSVTYTIVASNPAGPSAVTGAIVSDTLPASLSGATWTCTATGAGSSCPSNGSGDLAASVSLGVGGTATFTVTATIAPTAVGTLVNTATIAAPGVVDPTPATTRPPTPTPSPHAPIS